MLGMETSPTYLSILYSLQGDYLYHEATSVNSLAGTSLFVIIAVIVLLVVGLATPMNRIKKTGTAGKLRQKRSKKRGFGYTS